MSYFMKNLYRFSALIFVSFAGLAHATETIEGDKGTVIYGEAIAKFDAPWAMTFLSNDILLLSTKPGTLWLVNSSGQKAKIGGVPKVAYGGQGGLGDVVLHPDFKKNQLVYLSFVELSENGRERGAVVMRARLMFGQKPRLLEAERIWTQLPKRRSKGHFSHRLAFGPKGSAHEGKLFITSGDRQLQTPAQDFEMALGKVIRLNADGSVPEDNPFQNQGTLAKTFWSVGHRNALGLAFDQKGRLWSTEMGPRDGDELNVIQRGANYGWPIVSDGDNYNGTSIPDHATRPDLMAPKLSWVPTIAPSGLVIYDGSLFPEWKGDALIGGLRSRALIHVEIEGDKAHESERFSWGARVRDVAQAPDGSVWVLQDGQDGWLVKLTKQ